MVVNLRDESQNNNSLTDRPIVASFQEDGPNPPSSQESQQSQLREQLCAIQNHPQPDQAQTLRFTHQLVAQLLLASGASPTTENTPPPYHLQSDSTLSSANSQLDHQMDTPQNGRANMMNLDFESANSGNAGSPSSSHSNEMNGGDAEGVWSSDIDQAFHEALQIYPPCGRRKIILSEEGKMYGRNELIARYIKIRCGKTRTRKQVSSHIQVLARKKNRESGKIKTQDVKSEDGQQQSSNFGSPKSADSLASLTNNHGGGGSASKQPKLGPISPPTNGTNPLFQASPVNSTINGAQVKVEALNNVPALPSLIARAGAADAAAASVANFPQATQLQWPYNMMPGMFNNNNFYGGMANTGISNDENLYANFAAALSAQQQINAFGPSSIAPNVTSANPLLSAATIGGLPALGKLLPNLPFSTAAGPIFPTPPASNDVAPTGGAVGSRTIGSSKLVLCGFTAYVERQMTEGTVGPERIDIVKIPSTVDEPLESICFDSIRPKFPEVLEELFRKGPSDAFFLVKCWANVSFDIIAEDPTVLYAVDSFYNSLHNVDISISSKVCSFGKQVVEKVEVYSATEDDPSHPNTITQISSTNSARNYHYRLEKSPMCEYMVAFIRELKKLEISEMNCVLENFTVLQIIQNKQTDETLMVIAFNFEVSPEPDSNARIFKIVP